VGVQERAGSVNGYVDILSKPGEGTTVRVTVPL
jgi:signal transduction histidine kinase